LGTGAPGRPSRAKLGSFSDPRAQVVFDDKNVAAAIHSREALKQGKIYSGPAIITEYSATTVIPPRESYYLDRACNLIVTVR
jgi:N-methylhydantoinase A